MCIPSFCLHVSSRAFQHRKWCVIENIYRLIDQPNFVPFFFFFHLISIQISDAQMVILKNKNEHENHMGFEWHLKLRLTVSIVDS